MPIAVVLAAGLLGVWLLAYPRTPDLAAQAYRLGLYERIGFGVFDEHWYAGHALPGYSLLFAPLATLEGMRALAVVSVLASVALFEQIVLGVYGRDLCVRLGACLFAVAAVGDVWSGRLAFALGVSIALTCAYALYRERLLLAALLAGVCAAASPVAGALLALAGLTYALAWRAPRVLFALAGPVALVLVPVRMLFAEGGYEPYPFTSFAATVLVVAVFMWALPRGESHHTRVLRMGAVVYLIACGLCLLVHTPMGSNVERYGVLLAGPLLLCALAGSGGAARRRRGAAPPRLSPFMPSSGYSRRRVAASASWSRTVAAGVALCVSAVWIVWGPVRETAAVAGSQATQAGYYVPLERYLFSHGASLDRVEVPLTRSHWEAALLAPSVSLARGWEKQLEERYDSVLLAPGLTAGAYRKWLDEQAVAYVALPDVPLDSVQCAGGSVDPRGAFVSAAGVLQPALARVCGARCDAAADRPGPADGARQRHVRAGRPLGGHAAGAHPLHPLLHSGLRTRLRGQRPGGLDVCARPRAGSDRGRGAVLAGPGVGAGGRLPPGRRLLRDH